jgi:ATP-GRASP peptide maturase of grasp-with-spasm system
MIVIVTDIDEPTTDWVINWLHHYEKEFLRISFDDKIEIKEIYLNEITNKLECTFTVKGILINTEKITSYWYRRSKISMDNVLSSSNDEIDVAKSKFIITENQQSILLLNSILNEKAKLNKIEDNDLVKISNLVKANSAGLNIPDFIITNDKSRLQDFYIKHNKRIITKTIGDPLSFFKVGLHQYTSLVSQGDLKEIFSLGLFQECIEKKFELRIFYLNNTSYTSAVFSQENEKTSIDLKDYGEDNPNRVVPFELPVEIQTKIQILMKNLGLLSGSIDMAVNTKNQFVFIEVNPVGQFEQVSVPCNYNLPKLVAEIL